jgi:3-dehydro-4-phosphotetronate decarboxylase
MSTESKLRELICTTAASLFNRGLTHGSTGNISVRLPNGGWLMTPTGSSLGTLDPARLSKINSSGKLLAGDPPTKEAFLHTCMYAERPGAGAVVHLHSTHSVAVSCLDGIDCTSCLPPITAYFVMRVGTLPLVPYFPPGDEDLAKAVGKLAGTHHAMLLANHGPIVAGSSLAAATDAIEELEETARLFLLLKDRKINPLSVKQVAELRKRFPPA